jgi:hypothetical protein
LLLALAPPVGRGHDHCRLWLAATPGTLLNWPNDLLGAADWRHAAIPSRPAEQLSCARGDRFKEFQGRFERCALRVGPEASFAHFNVQL